MLEAPEEDPAQAPSDFQTAQIIRLLERRPHEVEGEAKWRLRHDLNPAKNPHPSLSECAVLLESLPPRRRERARQLFYHCIAREIPMPDPAALEAQLDSSIRVARNFLKTTQP